MQQWFNLEAATELAKRCCGEKAPNGGLGLIAFAIIWVVPAILDSGILTPTDCLTDAERRAQIAYTLHPMCQDDYCDDVQYQEFINDIVEEALTCDKDALDDKAESGSQTTGQPGFNRVT